MKEGDDEEPIESGDSLEGSLAIAFRRQARCLQYEAVLSAELEKQESQYGKGHRKTIVAQTYLAANLEEQGKHLEAERLRQQVLQAMKNVNVFGKQRPGPLRCMLAMGLALSRRTLYRKTEVILRKAHSVMVDVFGCHDVETLQCLDELASVLRARGMFKEAEQKHREVLGYKKRILGDEYRGTLDTRHRLSLLLFDQHKYEEARKLALQALRITEKTLGRDHPETLDTMDYHATVLYSQGNKSDAATLEFERMPALRRLRQHLWGDDPAIHHYIHGEAKQSLM